jgi:thiol:disulfide interchange protein
MRTNTFKMCPAMLAFSLLIAALVFSPCTPAFAGSILGWGWNRSGQVNPHLF